MAEVGGEGKAGVGGPGPVGIENAKGAMVFIAGEEIEIPGDLTQRLKGENGGLAFGGIEVLCLIGAIDKPVSRGKAGMNGIAGTQTGVVEGQEIEEVASGVVELVFGVIGFETERAGKLAEIERESVADRGEEGAVSLKEIAIESWTWFVGGGTLKQAGGLSELKIDAAAGVAPGG